MPGSYFTLDSLGDTMLAFGNTYLQVEGNTDSRGQRASQQDAVAEAGRLGEGLPGEELQHRPPSASSRWARAAANPVAPNETEDGRALNRRTDIKVVLNAQ